MSGRRQEGSNGASDWRCMRSGRDVRRLGACDWTSGIIVDHNKERYWSTQNCNKSDVIPQLLHNLIKIVLYFDFKRKPKAYSYAQNNVCSFRLVF